MDDDDLSFDDDMADDGDLDERLDVDESDDDSTAESTRGIASWRRIEMAKEDKYLESVLADLDDYYDFEEVDGEIVANYTS